LVLTAAGIGFVAFAFRGSASVPLSTGTPMPIAPAASNGDIWARVGGGDGPSFLYRVNPETGQTTALFNDGESTRSPLPGSDNPNAIGSQYAWSPDGSQVAFADYSGYGAEIFLMSPDGSTRTPLTHDGGLASFPSWSPDGTKIAYASDTAPPGGPDSPYYTPGCEYSFKMCPADIHVINGDGSGEVRLTNDPTGASMPSWSPDGSKIAFVSGRADPNGDIFVMNPDRSGVTQLTSGPGYDFQPQWSPDGSRIAFESSRGDSTNVYIMNADGSDVHRLTTTGNETRFAWSPDGKQIAFVGGGNSSQLYVMNADGSNIHAIASVPSYGFGEIAWRPLPLPSSTPTASTSLRSSPYVAPPRNARGHCVPPGLPPGDSMTSTSVTTGPVGTIVSVSGAVSHVYEDGSYRDTPTDYQIWWNVDDKDWTQVGGQAADLAAGRQPRFAIPEGTQMLGDVQLTRECSFQVDFTVPDVSAGTYPVTVIDAGNGAATNRATFTFTVTAP
jgi:dipeptidyl aminopeptidase/acylaminoacyl peptidase